MAALPAATASGGVEAGEDSRLASQGHGATRQGGRDVDRIQRQAKAWSRSSGARRSRTGSSLLSFASANADVNRKPRSHAKPRARRNAAALRPSYRRVRHFCAQGLSARRQPARGAFRSGRKARRSTLGQHQDAGRDAAAPLRSDAARVAVPRRAGAAAQAGRRRGSDLRTRQACSRTPTCSDPAAIPTAACRSRTTTPS